MNKIQTYAIIAKLVELLGSISTRIANHEYLVKDWHYDPDAPFYCLEAARALECLSAATPEEFEEAREAASLYRELDAIDTDIDGHSISYYIKETIPSPNSRAWIGANIAALKYVLGIIGDMIRV